MKTTLHLLASAALAAGVSLSAFAQNDPAPAPPFHREKGESGAAATSRRTDPSPTPLGAEKAFDEFAKIHVKNLQDQSLGRIKDLAIDLVNGRIVEVLVVADASLGLGNKIVAVPPLAFIPDSANAVYRLNVTVEDFKSAPGIDLAKWEDHGRSEKVAATYRHFGQEIYFLEEGAVADATDARPKVSLGYVERSSKIQDLPVENFQGDKFGKVWSLTLDIPRGRILSVIILAPGNFKTKSVVPAMALSFNAPRNGLLLDDSKREFADEPRFVFTEAAFGNEAHSQQEAYKGPHTAGPLAQGSSYRDIALTVRISKDIRAAKLTSRTIEVGTVDGRVTLRGSVRTEADKGRIFDLAVAASRLELVDNQIVVLDAAQHE